MKALASQTRIQATFRCNVMAVLHTGSVSSAIARLQYELQQPDSCLPNTFNITLEQSSHTNLLALPPGLVLMRVLPTVLVAATHTSLTALQHISGGTFCCCKVQWSCLIVRVHIFSRTASHERPVRMPDSSLEAHKPSSCIATSKSRQGPPCPPAEARQHQHHLDAS